jgi:His/Glu/Gln/Arg/opine family amino acid ABC transporter permease subunit
VNYNWNWGIFFQTSPDGVHTYLETLLMGTGWTLATALSAWCLALAMGSLIGVIRTTANPWLVRIGTAYVELFRNIPLLVQMFLWYFVLPELLPTALGDWLKQLPDASFYTAVVALGFYTSARVAEQVRAGILRTRDVRTRRRLRDRSLGPQPVGIGIRPHDYPCKTCVSTAMPLCHTPCTRPIERFGDIVAYPILGGLHHRYARI